MEREAIEKKRGVKLGERERREGRRGERKDWDKRCNVCGKGKILFRLF